MLVRILGALELEGGKPVGGGQLARLLGTLALRANHPVTAADLAEIVLGNERSAIAPQDLYVVVSRLRSVLRRASAAASIEHDHRGYRLVVGDADVDAYHFEGLVRQARTAPSDAQRVKVLSAALRLWRGRVLDGLDLPLDPAAVRLEELRLVVHEELLRLRLASGHAADALPELLSLCAKQPTREGLAALAMEALGRLGRRDEALAHYHRFRQSLATELGLEPSAELRTLERQLLEGETRPAEVMSRTRSAAPQPPLGRFVGRGDGLAEVNRFLEYDRLEDRLLTITGPGGVGKTRLVLEAASAARGRAQVVFVDLATLGRQGTTADTVAAAIGLAAGQACATVAELVGSMPDENLALLLDNCEHVVAAAAIAIRHLLSARRSLRILATSRQPLAIGGERLLQLKPLELGDAVQLLVDRAERVTGTTAHREELLRSVCQAVDGLPLAVELAASRLRSMTLAELVDRLSDQLAALRNPQSDERHASLANVIAWSVSLLPAQARLLFGRLGVFTGGFDVRAAVDICELGDEWTTIDALDQLVTASLLNPEAQPNGKMRYRMLDAVHQAATEALASDPEHAAIRGRHADHFAQLAGRPYDADTDSSLTTELPNLRSAVQLAIAAGDTHRALHITGRLGSFAMRQTSALEAEGWAHSALQLPGALEDPAARWTLHAIAIIRNLHGDAVGCEHYSRQALHLERHLQLEPDPRPLNTLALGVTWQGRLTEARRLADKALDLALQTDRPFEQIDALFNIVHCEKFEGRQPDPDTIARLNDVAESTKRDVARSIAAYGTAAAHLGFEDTLAAQRFQDCLDSAERADAHHLLVGPAHAFIALINAGGDPLRGLEALRIGLHHYADRQLAFGARRLTRDFFPTMIALGCHDAVAVLHGAAAPISYLPQRTRHAVLTARQILGTQRFEALEVEGKRMSDAQLITFTDRLTSRADL